MVFSKHVVVLALAAVPVLAAVLVLAAMALNVGCSNKDVPKDEPSYADLVVIYSAELESLDRLERKRKEMIDQYEAQHRPGADDALRSLTDAITSAGDMNREGTPDPHTDPNVALDQAVESAERTQQVAAQLLKSMTSATEAERAGAEQQVQYSEEFQQQLAAIDKEIAEQKARVERARQARDAEEKKRD